MLNDSEYNGTTSSDYAILLLYKYSNGMEKCTTEFRNKNKAQE